MNSEYSNSLFFLGKEENLLDNFYSDVKNLCYIFNNKEINKFFENRFIKNDVKKDLLKDVLINMNEYVKNFIYIIIEDNKAEEIIDILKGFIELYYKEKNISKGKVFGVSLEKEKIKQLEDILSKKLNKTISLEFVKDDSLIAGYKVIVDNKLYDNSYKKKLDNLKNSLLKEGGNND